MHYELYVDSLIFVNFMMNLYLLLLLNGSTLRTATPLRILLGAAMGTVGFLIPFLTMPNLGPGILLGLGVGMVGMLLVTFAVRSLKTFLRLLERLLLYSFLLGGALLYCVKIFPALANVPGIVGVGGIVFLAVRRFCIGKNLKSNLCKVTLRNCGRTLTLTALVDSGNSLVEPISGKCVCVIEREVFEALWENEPIGFRVIPYHSVGKKRGIMPGYLLEELQTEVDGLDIKLNEVYVAVSKERIGEESKGIHSVKMIINPGLFMEQKVGRPRKRQNERRNDFKSGNAGKNAI